MSIRRRRRIAVAVSAFGVALALSLLVSAYATGEVVERGDLLPWGGDDIKRIDIWGGLDFYVSSESELPTPDLITSGFLLVVASVCGLAAWLLLIEAGRSDRSAFFFPVAALGALYLAVDEYGALHESIGHNLGFLADLPRVERPDDVVFTLYLLPAAAFLWVFRRVITGSRAALGCFAVGTALSLLASVLDISGTAGKVEDSAELLASAALVGGFIVLAVENVTEVIRHPPDTV